MSVIRIAETPAWQRLSGWWGGLSDREKWLVGTLGILLALVVLVYGIIKPLQAERAQAIADIRTFETLNARIRAAGTLGPSGPPPRTGPVESVVGQSASAQGLVAQIEGMPGGARATIADASYDAVINWMADIARTSSVSVRSVDIRRAATPGRVSATIEFGG